MSTITVGNTAALQAAYSTMSMTSGGGTILIDPNAAPFQIILSGGGSQFVTIASADADNPSSIAGINLSNVSNVKIDNINLNSDSFVRADWLSDINVSSSSNITISNSTMTSDASGFYSLSDPNAVLGEDLGLIRDSNGITFENNTVSGYNQGLKLQESTNLKVLGNEFTQMQSDGMRLVGVQDVLIQGNNFNNFYGSTATFNHDDMIQFWSTGATLVTRNVTIDGNVFNSGDGSGSQTIFMGNEKFGQGDTSSVYQNIAITNNVIYNGHLHAITVAGANNVLIDNNVLAWDKDAIIVDDERTPGVISNVNYQPGINLYSVTNGTVTDNVAGIYNLSTGTVTSGNTTQEGIAALGQNYVFDLLDMPAGDIGSGSGPVGPTGPTVPSGPVPPPVPVDPPAPTDPVDPPAPTDPVAPGSPTPPHSVDPTVPTDPVDPPAPTDPVDPGSPTPPHSVDPTSPTDPVDPPAPTDPVDPTVPTDPVDPGNPPPPHSVDPTVPTEPNVPSDPVDPVNPTAPVDHNAPAAAADLVDPTPPVDSVETGHAENQSNFAVLMATSDAVEPVDPDVSAELAVSADSVSLASFAQAVDPVETPDPADPAEAATPDAQSSAAADAPADGTVEPVDLTDLLTNGSPEEISAFFDSISAEEASALIGELNLDELVHDIPPLSMAAMMNSLSSDDLNSVLEETNGASFLDQLSNFAESASQMLAMLEADARTDYLNEINNASQFNGAHGMDSATRDIVSDWSARTDGTIEQAYANAAAPQPDEVDPLAADELDVSVTGGECFVATVAYADGAHPDVEYLRRVRDQILMYSAVGRGFVWCYWRVGPILADWLRPYPKGRAIARAVLAGLIGTMSRRGVVDRYGREPRSAVHLARRRKG